MPSYFSAIQLALGMLFIGHTTSLIVLHLAKAGKVTADLLLGAAAAYLLLGLFFMFLYGLLIKFDLTAFNNIDSPVDIMYFSYTTLTTLGYGDITPVSPLAKSFSILQAVVGVLFSAILVARLVGLYLATGGDSQSVKKLP